jgi:ferric-dicitrate binding protein FerR (iron transport regulator)
MPEIRLKIPTQIASRQVEELQAGLQPYAEVRKQAMESFAITSVTLIVAFTANALKIADILAGWLERTPHGNLAEIRLPDGRTFKMNATTNPDVFGKQLKAALKDLIAGNAHV